MKRLLALGLAISLGGVPTVPHTRPTVIITRTPIPTGRHRPRAIRVTRRRRAISDRLRAINCRLRLVATSSSH
jgi:hypothetical protein